MFLSIFMFNLLILIILVATLFMIRCIYLSHHFLLLLKVQKFLSQQLLHLPTTTRPPRLARANASRNNQIRNMNVFNKKSSYSIHPCISLGLQVSESYCRFGFLLWEWAYNLIIFSFNLLFSPKPKRTHYAKFQRCIFFLSTPVAFLLQTTLAHGGYWNTLLGE